MKDRPVNDVHKQFFNTIIDTIFARLEAAGDDGVPSGHLYALLQGAIGQAWSLQVHQTVIGELEQLDVITNDNHLLRLTRAARVAKEAARLARGES